MAPPATGPSPAPATGNGRRPGTGRTVAALVAAALVVAGAAYVAVSSQSDQSDQGGEDAAAAPTTSTTVAEVSPGSTFTIVGSAIDEDPSGAVDPLTDLSDPYVRGELAVPGPDDIGELGLLGGAPLDAIDDRVIADGSARSFCLSDGPAPLETTWRTWASTDGAEVSARVQLMSSEAEARRAVVKREAPSFTDCILEQARPNFSPTEEQPTWDLVDEASETDDERASRIVLLGGAEADCPLVMAMGWRQVQRYEVAVYVASCEGADEASLADADALLDVVEANLRR